MWQTRQTRVLVVEYARCGCVSRRFTRSLRSMDLTSAIIVQVVIEDADQAPMSSEVASASGVEGLIAEQMPRL